MKSLTELDGVFPLSAGSSERAALHAPRLAGNLAVTPGLVLGHSAFMRAWAARRLKTASIADDLTQLRASAVSLR